MLPRRPILLVLLLSWLNGGASTFLEQLVSGSRYRVADAALTASAAQAGGCCDAVQARISNAAGATLGSWYAGVNAPQPYIQVDLGSQLSVYRIDTRGSPGVDYWVQSYSLLVSQDGVTWSQIQVGGVKQVFEANTDRNSIESNTLEAPVRTRYVRLQTETCSVISGDQHCALRWEIYGNSFCECGVVERQCLETALAGATCQPCQCAEEWWCQPCVCPQTAFCQCYCVDPDSTPEDLPIEENQDPPAVTPTYVATALHELRGNMSDIENDLAINRTVLMSCFPAHHHAIKTGTNAVRRLAAGAAEAAHNCTFLLDELDSAALRRQLDVVIRKLGGALKKMDEFYCQLLQIIAAEVGTDICNIDWDDPDQTGPIIEAYDPDTAICRVAKYIIECWHPTFWFWNWTGVDMSIWHKLYYFWFYINYIKLTIRIKVWWWWVWKPWGWPWFWPWGFCPSWWPYSWPFN